MFASLIVAQTSPDPSMLTIDVILLGIMLASAISWLVGRRRRLWQQKPLALPPWAMIVGTLCIVINALFQLRGF